MTVIGEVSIFAPYFRLSPADDYREREDKEYERTVFQKVSMCDHIDIEDGYGCACVNCGLRDSLWRDKDNLSKGDSIRFDYLKRFERRVIGFNTGIKCELKQGMDVFAMIKEENKGATRERLISEFIKSMEKIQKEEKKLGLKPKDIC